MENLYDLSLEAVSAYIHQIGEKDFRAKQIWEGLYQQAWTDLIQFTTLPLSLRDQIAEQYYVGSLSLEKERSSEDGTTRKYLYRLQDGLAIETVLMAYSDRQTVCISSQVGCAMGCDFCATGNMGLSRNLTRGEIIEQGLLSSAILTPEG